MLTVERKKEVIKILQGMIKKKSYSGQEKYMAEFFKETLKKLGYDNIFINEYGCVIASIKGKYKGPKILLEGHMDTVPVIESQWKENPFGGEIKDGKIYGRGASDMKGALCCMALAANYFGEDLKREFKGEIFVAGSVHEECLEGVAAKSIGEYVKPDYVIIGEPSKLNLKIGQKGRAEIVVETFGKPAHSSNPKEGVNAVYNMMELIKEIKKIPLKKDEELGEGILELTDIKSSPYPGASVVPDYCKVTYDRRLLVGETKEEVLKPIEEIIKRFEKEEEKFKAKVSYANAKEKCWTKKDIEGDGFFPAWKYEKEEDYIQKAYDALKSIGQDPKIEYWYFCTNASYYAGKAKIKTIGYGPSKESLAHTIDEYIEINQLYKGIEGYYEILKTYLK